MNRFMRWVCKVLGKHDLRAFVLTLNDDLGNTEHVCFWRCARCDHFTEMSESSGDQLRLLLEPEDIEAETVHQSLELH